MRAVYRETLLLVLLLPLLGCGGKSDGTGPLQVDDLVKEGFESKAGKELQVHGYVKPGSIRYKVVDQSSVHNFVLERKGAELPVVMRGPVPDTLKDGAEFLAIGTWTGTELEIRELQGRCYPPEIAAGQGIKRPAWCD